MGVGHGVLLAGMLWAAAAAHAQSPRLTILTEHAPPTSMLADGSDSTVVGSGSDKVREIMQRTGLAYSIELLPWKRAYTAALTRPDTCVFSTTRLPEREPLFKWIGPTDGADWVLLARADRGYALTTLDDARKLRIGTYNGDARDAFLRERGFIVDAVQDDMINPQKLLLGRIDLWAASLRRGSMMLEQNGWNGKIVQVLSLKQVDVYLACNLSVPDALVARMNAAVDAMNRDGTMKKIDRKYDAWQAVKAK